MKAHGKKLSLIIDKAGYGIGFLMALSVTDGKQIGNLTVSKWNNGITGALIEMMRRHPENKLFRELSQCISGFFEDLALGRLDTEYCRAQIIELVKGQEINGVNVWTLIAP
jgi:hypothetical protein